MAVAWYVCWNVFHKRFPIAYDAQKIMENSIAYGIPSLMYVSVLLFLIYLSFMLSGVFLIKRNRIAAIIAYVQTPFRLVMAIPPSIFFILWPMKYMFETPQIVLGVVLVAVSEIIKLATVVIWHRSFKPL